MIFEFMGQGDLHEYLIMHSPHSDISAVDPSRAGGTSKTLEYPDMLHISTQVLLTLMLERSLVGFLRKGGRN